VRHLLQGSTEDGRTCPFPTGIVSTRSDMNAPQGRQAPGNVL